MQLVARDDVLVFAAARAPGKAPSLLELQEKHGDKLHLLTLDVTDGSSIEVRPA